MRTELLIAFGLAASIHAIPLEANDLEQLLDLLPRQANITCPPTPNPMPKAAAFPSVKTMPDPFLYLDGKTRVQSKDEWYQCRQPEILKALQEYQYGYYPDHSLETVTATRSGNSLTVTVAAGGKSASIVATLNLPSGSGPFPVVISIGGMDTKSYTSAGIAVVTFDYGKVAADSNSKTGSFWTLYNGKDIGTYLSRPSQLRSNETARRPDSLGMGLPSRPRRYRAQSPRNRRHKVWRDGLFSPRQSSSSCRPFRQTYRRHDAYVLRCSRSWTIPVQPERTRREFRELGNLGPTVITTC